MGWLDRWLRRSHERRELDELEKRIEHIEKGQDLIGEGVAEILRVVRPHPEPSSLSQITQLGESMPTDNSIVAGTSGVFQVSPLPAGSAFAPGNLPVWAASDPTVTLSAPAGVTDGSQISAAVPSGNTSPFNLQATYTRTDGTVLQSPVLTVTVTPSGPPPTNEPTSLSAITQIS